MKKYRAEEWPSGKVLARHKSFRAILKKTLRMKRKLYDVVIYDARKDKMLAKLYDHMNFVEVRYASHLSYPPINVRRMVRRPPFIGFKALSSNRQDPCKRKEMRCSNPSSAT